MYTHQEKFFLYTPPAAVLVYSTQFIYYWKQFPASCILRLYNEPRDTPVNLIAFDLLSKSIFLALILTTWYMFITWIKTIFEIIFWKSKKLIIPSINLSY